MNTNSSNKIFELSPADAGKITFIVPIYQRLYAWERSEIEQLLNDLYSSFEKNPDKDYYIGNLILSTNENQSFNIIDGQQRFTTLNLIASVFREEFPAWQKFLSVSINSRLSYSSRDEIVKIMDMLSTGNSINNIPLNEQNAGLISGVKIIREFKESMDQNMIASFAEYMYNHTKLICVVLNYAKRELNKYFEVMNNRSVQLEKHVILKSRLLSVIPQEQRQTYSSVWDACSQMNQYIESFFYGGTKNNIPSLFTSVSDIESTLKVFAKENCLSERKTLREIMNSIRQNIVNGKDKNEGTQTAKKKSENDVDRYTSVCNFPDFLLHVYKLVSKQYEKVKINNKDLLEIIQIPDNSNDSIIFATSFIKHLLYYRILFDNYVIKGSYSGSSDFSWKIRQLKIQADANSYVRSHDSESTNLEQIQSMLNVSTQPEHWLTPYLKYVSEQSQTFDSLTAWLEALDKRLALTRVDNNLSLIKTANSIINDTREVYNNLGEYNDSWNKGFSTERYWFFKLDYCLWKEYMSKNVKDYTIINFRFRPNNSVEHVHAQSERNENQKWDSLMLNRFGNLCLISVSANSEYNDQEFNHKRLDFKSRSEKWGYESLKLFEIYKNDFWDAEICKRHEKEMISLLEKYHT